MMQPGMKRSTNAKFTNEAHENGVGELRVFNAASFVLLDAVVMLSATDHLRQSRSICG